MPLASKNENNLRKAGILNQDLMTAPGIRGWIKKVLKL